MRMRTISVKLPESLARWLEEQAKVSQQSRSAIVREALESKRTGGGSGPGKRETMAQVMEDSRGTISGPSDLSTHPDYLDGMGK